MANKFHLRICWYVEEMSRWDVFAAIPLAWQGGYSWTSPRYPRSLKNQSLKLKKFEVEKKKIKIKIIRVHTSGRNVGEMILYVCLMRRPLD